MKKIGITGSRDGFTDAQWSAFTGLDVWNSPVSEFHHGDCVGVDIEAALWVRDRLKVPIIVHPPTNRKLRAMFRGDRILPEKSYMDRNRDIVIASDLLIVVPREGSRGTPWTRNFALASSVPFIEIREDGTTREVPSR